MSIFKLLWRLYLVWENVNTMNYTKEELLEGIQAMDSLIKKSEKTLPNLVPGTGPHTTLTRRLKAFKLTKAILEEKLSE